MSTNIEKLRVLIAESYELGRFERDVLLLPGAPNLTAIKSSAFYRMERAVQIAKLAEEQRRQAVEDLTNELLEDWSSTELASAFAHPQR